MELAPASVTKVMYMLLIFEALSSGNIHLTDEVTVSSTRPVWEVPRFFSSRAKYRRWKHS